MKTTLLFSKQFKKTRKLALFTCVFALLVILLGAYTRLTNAGLSCPDWPNCFGLITAPHTANEIAQAKKFFPQMTVDVKKAWTEMVHRYFAGTESLLIFLLIVSVFRIPHPKKISLRIAALVLIGLIGIQIILGKLTVTQLLKPAIVSGHLLTGLTILAVLWWIYLTLKQTSTIEQKYSTWHFWASFGLLLLGFQIALGGWVSTHYAGLACIDFPYCNGALIPKIQLSLWYSDLITIHMLHRFGALIVGTYFLLLSVFLLFSRDFKFFGFLLAALICTQITLGILNLWWLRPTSIALAHHFTAILLLLSTIALVLKTKYASEKPHHYFNHLKSYQH